MTVATTKDTMKLFDCSEPTAKRKMKQVREALGKRVNNDGKKGADPITFEQIVEHFKLK